MTTCTIGCTTASGKTMEALGKLIALRAQRMGEFTSDAVVATAIDCLVSLRSETRDASDGDGKDVPRQIYHCADLFPSYTASTNPPHPCARRGSRNGPRLMENIRFSHPGMDLKCAQVYRVTPMHEADPKYYIFANSPEDVLQYEHRRIRRRIMLRGGLARTALGIAMAKISTRPAQVSARRQAAIIASRVARISVSAEGWASGRVSLNYYDGLNYAIAALRSGPSGVDAALQRAANKVAGLITHKLHKAGDFEHDVATPFPEVRRAR